MTSAMISHHSPSFFLSLWSNGSQSGSISLEGERGGRVSRLFGHQLNCECTVIENGSLIRIQKMQEKFNVSYHAALKVNE